MPAKPAAALGIFLFVVAAYSLVSAGRIDIIDGQYRFEVARSLIAKGSVRVYDEFLFRAIDGTDGRYSPYGLSGSVVALPLVVLGNVTGPDSVDRQQFFFSFTSPVFGAATSAVIFLFLVTLRVPRRQALVWTLVASFATLAFPAATTVFDQTQHAFFVAAAGLAAFWSARRDSLAVAAAGGLALAILVNFQETYALMIPTLALATLAPVGAPPSERNRGWTRAAVFIAVGALGLLAWAAFNYSRFDALLPPDRMQDHPAPFGNPLVGLLGLTISPGKSIFLYSPVTAAAAVGIRGLWRDHRRLAQAVLAACAAHLMLISSLSFYGGDWCWGPRYFVPLLPLLALGLPYLPTAAAGRRTAVTALIAISVAVQLLALTLDHHRFFYVRSLPPYFWADDTTFYFRESALLARPGEALESIRRGPPPEVEAFRPGPYPDLLTYAVFGGWGHPEMPLPEWVRRYSVFWLPRPWTLWMRMIPEEQRPVTLAGATSFLLLTGLAGATLTAWGVRRTEGAA